MKQVLIAIDQLINALIGGYADETLSAKAYRLRLHGWSRAYHIINFIFFWQDNHCESAWLSEKERKQLPVEYR